MKQSVNFSQFCDAFHHAGRADQFSYEAKQILFDALEEVADGTGQEYELDVIALCCEFSEDSADNIADMYSIDLEGVEPDDVQQAVEEFVQDHTFLCGTTKTGNLVYAQF